MYTTIKNYRLMKNKIIRKRIEYIGIAQVYDK